MADEPTKSLAAWAVFKPGSAHARAPLRGGERRQSVGPAPSAHYALILDDHGSGLGGLLWGDPSNKDFITLPELKLALNTASDQTQRKIDVLYMAMCLMGMLGDAYQVCGLVDCCVASDHVQMDRIKPPPMEPGDLAGRRSGNRALASAVAQRPGNVLHYA